jgi:EmrB/QacA subfamily drug resistance transporter
MAEFESMLRRGARARVQIIIATIVGMAFMMEQLDATIITTSTPQIAASLSQSPLRINLAITSYLLTLITFMPVSGWLADRFGARRVFCAALGIFTVGSMFCGLATSLPMLLAMRMLQGLGGGLMTPVGRLVLLRAFPRSQLVKAMTWFNIPVVIGPTLGPVIGGLITTYTSWHWIFFVNLPFGVLGILAALRFVPDLRRQDARRFDLTGFILAGGGLALLQCGVQGLGLAVIPWGWIGIFLAASGCLMAVYQFHASKIRHPVFDLQLLRIHTFRIGTLAGGLSRVGINGMPYLLPLLLQLGFGKSPLESGLLVAVTCLGIVLVRPVSAPLLLRLGFGRLLCLNSLLGAGCIALFTALHAATPDSLILLVILAFSLMRGMQFATLNTLSYADIPRERLSQSTSLGGIAQQITMGLGVSISAALLNIFSAGSATVTLPAFAQTILTLSAITLVSALGFLRLGPQDGARALPAATGRGNRRQPATLIAEETVP